MSEEIRKPMSDRPQLDLSGLSLVLGLGLTGVSVARFIGARGGTLRIADSRAQPPGRSQVEQLNAEVICGPLDDSLLDGVSRLVLSPGLSIDAPICRTAQRRGIAIINDIEIFARICEAPVIAVTGSNGKSTVVSLVAEMLKAEGIDAVAGGNLGPPALDLLEVEADVCVLEISSFQMEAAESLAPLAAAVLNISADHLDRHPSIEAYAALKEKLLRNAQNVVVNIDDPRVRAMGLRRPGCIEFSTQRELQRGYSIVDGSLAVDGRSLTPVSQLAMAGRHNAANALAALALSTAFAQLSAPMLTALQSFPGLPHRCEFVARVAGRTYINDSKATNTGATNAALNGLAGPLVLIAGGQGKGADFDELREAVRGKVHSAVLIGEDAPQIAAAIGDLCSVELAPSLIAAVASAQAQSRSGDTVLLSPACASFDMFADYTERGRAFKAAVKDLSP